MREAPSGAHGFKSRRTHPPQTPDMIDTRARLAEAVREGIVSPDRFRTDTQGTYHDEADDHAVRNLCITAWRAALKRKPLAVVLLCGAPGAGKSTWLKQNRRRDTLYYDGTCAHARTRALLCKIAREHGVEPRIVWVATPLDECLHRNAHRARCTPDDVVRRIHRAISNGPPHEAHVDVVSADSAVPFDLA